ncbi:hypothetical protein V8F33_012921 [Rhypophila sp. PSN 637]
MIIIEKRKHAFPYAKFFDDDASSPEDDNGSSDSGNMDLSSGHLVIWTDASWHKYFAGVGLVFRNQQKEKEWLEYGYTILPPLPKDFSYELLGIGLALKTAAEQVAASSHSKSSSSERAAAIKRVTISNDSQDAIHKSEKHIHNYFGVPLFGPEPVYGGVQTLSTGAKSLEQLWDHGVEVEIRWSPGHCGIQGNERADEVAKLAARYGFTSLSLAGESESLPSSSLKLVDSGDGLVEKDDESLVGDMKEVGGLNGNGKPPIVKLAVRYVLTGLGLSASTPTTPSTQMVVVADSGAVIEHVKGVNENNGNIKPSIAKLVAGYGFTGLGLSAPSLSAQVVVAGSSSGSRLEGDRDVDVDGTARVKVGNGKGQGRAEAISGCSLPPAPPDSEGEVVVVSSTEIKKRARRKRKKGKGTDTSGTGTSSTETTGTSSELAHDGRVPFWLRAPPPPPDYSNISGSGSGEQQKQEPQPGEQPQQQQQEEDKPSPDKVRIMRLPVPVLRAVDEMMHMVDGMNDRTAAVKKLKQTMARRAVELLKKAGQEEGWIIDGYEI